MKKILIISSFILVIISISTVGYNIVSANEKVFEVEDILTYQENKEKYLTPYGYTIDNPNIILNPYGISPLTALILFETEEEQPVTITIQGKDESSTYTNTFESTNRHYIPVYGLYPNANNTIKIECGNITKNINIETTPLPIDLLVTETITNDTNNLTFITSDTYPYALDNNNEVRWYLTKKYSSKIDYLQNNHLLLSNDNLNPVGNTNSLVEIDLLGKIYKQYNLDTPYQGDYEETDTSLIIKSNNNIEIDKQTGTILNVTEQSIEVFSKTTNNNYQTLQPLYTSNKEYNITKSIKYNLTKETKQSDKHIFLIGYINPDKTYNYYNIKINKTIDNLQITGDFTKDDEVYLILDKFLDKRIYDIDTNHITINKEGLQGKYSIYISINDTIYKTNNYIKY